jgi:hypothetical protein
MNIKTLALAFSILLLIIGASAPVTNAQALAQAKRPASVPKGYLVTPFGYFAPSCVIHLQKGDTLLPDDHAIRHANGSFDTMTACKYPHYDARGQMVSNTKSTVTPPSIGHSWIEAESVTTSSSYGKLLANWTVPPTPTANDGQVIYLFPGLEDINDRVGILQPVLGWNADFSSAWGIASWDYVNSGSGTLYESSPVRVNPNDLISGTIQSDCSAGTLTCGSWTITTKDQNTGSSTVASQVSNNGQTLNWAFGGVLEVYSISQCSDFPPNGTAYFNGVALYDNNFNQISNPGWTADSYYSNLTPQCNYGAEANATTVAVNYGPSQTATPTSSGTYTTQGQTDPTITFTEILYDTTPGAEIYWQVSSCSGYTSGSDPMSSGDSFTLVYQSSSNCNPSGTMYATAPGFSQSQTTAIQFP